MTTIFIESKHLKTPEANFVKTYINEKFPDFKDFEIIPLNGWEGLWKTNKLIENKDLGIQNVVLFDADTLENSGGFKERKAKIETIKTEQGVEFELFLFPNNLLDGDFELVLENIINQEHKKLLDCFEEYEKCVDNSKGDSSLKYKLPIRKAKIYSYVDAFPKSRKQNERFKNGDWFFENKTYWNLDDKFLINLKQFIEKIINQTP
jgi:hypothetical protein